MKPLVAIVGRPNVGKSTFFNRIIGRRIAIVEDTPGVTRDRIYADTEWLGHPFTLIDTGGLELFSTDVLYSRMREQATLAAETADVILFFLDGQQGLTAEDYDVADYLRRCAKPTVVVVNKLDSAAQEDAKYDYYALGMGEPYAISAVQGLGLGDVLDAVIAELPETQEEEDEEDTIRIAIVGRPNAGKSSLVNAILKEDRVIVSDIAGTTRDAIDTPFTDEEGNAFVLIDTAGMRRKGKIEQDSLERYSVLRSLTAVRRCDICFLMVDADAGIAEQDAKIAGYIHQEGKPVIIVVNKWDLVEKDTGTMAAYEKKVRDVLSFMTYAPILFISCKSGQRLPKLLPLTRQVVENSHRRITTGILNDVLRDATTAFQAPSTASGRRLKILYATQAQELPPTFVLFVNDAELMHYSYERYLENHLRKTFDFIGTPIRLVCRSREKEEKE